MQKRVAKRYAAERRFRLFGLAAVSMSVAFLAFLLITMAWKGLGGFTQTEAKLTIDFPRSDLFIEEAALRGPQAQEVVATAGLEGVLEQAAIAQFGEGAGELFGGASARVARRAADRRPRPADAQGRAVAAAVVQRRMSPPRATATRRSRSWSPRPRPAPCSTAGS